MRNILATCLFIVASSCYVAGQANNDGLRVTMKGYIINIANDIIFQPCDDSTSVWQALDKRSFSLECNRFENQFCDAIENIGDSEYVELQVDSAKPFKTSMRFFYCSIDIYLAILGDNKNDFRILPSPQYQINFNHKKYYAKGLCIRGIVQSLIPESKEDKEIMKNYYVKNKLILPKWLQE